MIVICNKCGEKYERFNVGGYQEESPHDCDKKKSIPFFTFFIFVVVLLLGISFVSASCTRVRNTFINNQGNFTVNESSCYINSIVDKSSGYEILDLINHTGKELGMSYRMNNIYYNNYNQPSIIQDNIPKFSSPSIDDSVVLYMKFNNDSVVGESYNNSGDLIFDYSNSQNNGSNDNSVFSKTDGFFGDGAFHFNGIDERIKIPDSDSLARNSTAMTWYFWGKQDSYITNNGYITKYRGDATNLRSWRIFSNKSGNIAVSFSNDGTANQQIASLDGCGLETGKWVFIAVTYNSTHVSFYKDGNLCNTEETTISQLFNNNAQVELGVEILNTKWFNGSMDEVRIYNVTLSDSQIKNIYDTYSKKQDISINNSNEFSCRRLEGNFNITYNYKCYDESFDINYSIHYFGSNSIMQENISTNSLSYYFPLNQTLFYEDNVRFVPKDNNDFTLWSNYSDIQSSTIWVRPAFRYGSPESIYFRGDNIKFLIQSKNDKVLNPTPSFSFYDFGYIMRMDQDTPLRIIEGYYVINSSQNIINKEYSFVLGNNLERSKMYAFNISDFQKNESYLGFWSLGSSSGWFDGSSLTDAAIQNRYNNGVRLTWLGEWEPRYGDFPSNDSNWLDLSETYLINKTFINYVCNQYKKNGIVPLQYFNFVEMQYQKAINEFPDYIVLNRTGDYQRGNWGSLESGKTYLMKPTGAYKDFMINQLENVLSNYTNCTGIFIDRGDYALADYSGTKYADIDVNKTYNSYSEDFEILLENATTLMKFYNRTIMLNVPRETYSSAHNDFTSLDLDSQWYKIGNVRLTSLGKYSYTALITVSEENKQGMFNYTLLFGSIPYWSGWLPNNLLESQLYMNKITANSEIIDWDSDAMSVQYPNVFALRKSKNLTFSSNTDWYDMTRHKLMSNGATSYYYVYNISTPNLIYYNFTADNRYHLNLSESSPRLIYKDVNGLEIDRLFDSYNSTQNKIINNIEGNINITFGEEFNNVLAFNQSGRLSLGLSSDINSNDLTSGQNFTMLQNENVTFLEDYNNCSESLQTSTGNPCGRQNSPLSITQNTETVNSKIVHINSSLTNTINLTVQLQADCNRLGSVVYTSNTGTYNINYVKSTIWNNWFYQGETFTCSNGIVTLNNVPLETATNSNEFELIYNVQALSACNQSVNAFLSYIALIGLIGSLIFLGLTISYIAGIVDKSQFNKYLIIEAITTLILVSVLLIVSIFIISTVCSVF